MNFRDVTIRIPDQPFLDKAEVAKLIRVSQRTLERWVREGYFPTSLRGGVWSDMQVGVWLQWRVYGPQPLSEADRAAIEPDEHSEGDEESTPVARHPAKPARGN